MTQPTPPVRTANEIRRRRVVAFLPLALFLGLAGLFYVQLYAGDPQTLPSALIGRPAPDFALPPVPGLAREGQPTPALARADLLGGVTLVNVWASWCVPCRDEHPVLMQMADDPRFRLVGLNYKDDPGNAASFLADLGNPYAAVGSDRTGRAGIDWGVYGVPETFVVDADGLIRFKFIGPLTPEDVVQTLLPEVEKAGRPLATAGG